MSKDNANKTNLWLLHSLMSKPQREEFWSDIVPRTSPVGRQNVLYKPHLKLNVAEANKAVFWLQEEFPDRDISLNYLSREAGM